MRLVIAVDGPAASGKGTLARRLAANYNISYLDTGSLYRAVARDVLAKGCSPEDANAALQAARCLDAETLEDPALRHQGVGAAASVIAKMPDVRVALLDFQRNFVKETSLGQANGAQTGGVLDGRDIGTVVFPDATVKLFVTASAEARGKRRFEELKNRGENVCYEDILAEIRVRDERDQNRAVAPLKPAPDAHLLNTTNLSIEEAYRAAIARIETVINALGYAS